MNCRICDAQSAIFYGDSRTFYKCPVCALIFTGEFDGGEKAEKHYKGQWANADADFWSKQVDVLVGVIGKYRNPAGRVLDFGSGSGDITKEFQARGIDATPLEPMIHGYLKDQRYRHKFDVVVGVEVIEHLPNLMEELKVIDRFLSDGAIMIFTTALTNTFIDSAGAADVFKGWWYKDDRTHVSFFSNKSIAKLAEICGYGADVYGEQLFVLKRLP